MDLAVGDGIKLLHDLLWKDDAVFFRAQRMRRGQSINSKHLVHVVQYHQVLLGPIRQEDTQKALQQGRVTKEPELTTFQSGSA